MSLSYRPGFAASTALLAAFAAIIAGAAMVAFSGRALAGPMAPDVPPPATRPSVLEGVGIDQKLNTQVPADLTFRDETGATVHLGDYFHSQRPMVLSLVYFKCPMLCTMVLNDLTRTLVAMRGDIGKDFDVLTVSFDPREKPELASKKKAEYVRAYRRAGAEQGWHFLTGDQESIKRLTDAVGFRYEWDEKHQQFAHASGIMVLTPGGRVARYFYGVDYSPRDLRLSLAEAAEGKISTPVDQVLLYCFHYDPSTGKYSLMITRLLRLGGIVTLVVLGSAIFLMSRGERRRSAAAGSAAETAGSTAPPAPPEAPPSNAS